MISTGNAITSKLGIKMTEPELGSWEKSQQFIEAPEVEEIAIQLIERFRPDLKAYEIAYAFKEKASKSKDRVTYGYAKKENPLSYTKSKIDSYIVIGFDMWITLDEDQKARLIFHELCHLSPNMEKGVIEMEDHPVQEFPEVVKVFGPSTEQEINYISAYQTFSKENRTLIDEINEQRNSIS